MHWFGVVRCLVAITIFLNCCDIIDGAFWARPSSECYVSQHLNKGTLETMARQIQRRHSEMVAMEELAKKELEEVSELCPSLHFMPE